MSNSPVYVCTQCGGTFPRKELIVKKINFVGMGAGARTVRSRVTDWLCPDCLHKDSDFNRQPWVTPGNEVKRQSHAF